MSDYSIREEAEAVLSDLARAKGRLELVLGALPGREVGPDLCSRLVAISAEARTASETIRKKAESLHRLSQREAAVAYGYAPRRSAES